MNRRVLLALLALGMNAIANGKPSGGIRPDGSCPILSLIPFSLPPYAYRDGKLHPLFSSWETPLLQGFGYHVLAATQLAIDHLNARDSSVVPAIEQLPTPCNATISMQSVADSELDSDTSVFSVIQSVATSTSAGDAVMGSSSIPCAILGPLGPKAVMNTLSVASSLESPHLLAGMVQERPLRDASASLTTGWEYEALASSMLDYLQQPAINRNAMLVLTQPALLTVDTASYLVDLGPKRNFEIIPIEFPPKTMTAPGGPPSTKLFAQDGVLRMKESGVKTVFLNFEEVALIARIADTLQMADMLTPEYLYIVTSFALPGSFVSTSLLGTFEAGSAADLLLSGALLFDSLDGFTADPANDPFLKAWKQQDKSFVQRLNTMLPKSSLFPAPDPDFFQKHDPFARVAFVYDAVMTLGFANCLGFFEEEAPPPPLLEEEQEKSLLGPTSNPAPAPKGGEGLSAPPTLSAGPDDRRRTLREGPERSPGIQQHSNQRGRTLQSPPPPESKVANFWKGVERVDFGGASGRVIFRCVRKNNRHALGIMAGLYNLRPVPDGQAHSYEAVLTATWVMVNETTMTGSWESKADFVYRDGTPTAPSGQREIQDSNYLSAGVRAAGLTFMAIAWLTAVVSMVLLWRWREDEIIRRAQPFFLQLLCVASILTTAAIFCLSWDEGAGWTDAMLDLACMACMWFFFLGNILTFASLATKLYRLDRVLQFRRNVKITIGRVIVPQLVVLLVALVVLSLWSSLDPWSWNRVLVSRVPAITYGRCECRHFWAFFGPLMGLLIAAEVVAAVLAWKTADVPEDFRDTSAVLYAVLTQLQAWIVGVPILAVLGTASADATYLGRVLLIFILSMSAVCVVVGPKLFRALWLRRNPGPKIGDRVRVTGVRSSASRTATYEPRSFSRFTDSDFRRSSRRYAAPPSPGGAKDLDSLVKQQQDADFRWSSSRRVVPPPPDDAKDRDSPMEQQQDQVQPTADGENHLPNRLAI